MRCRGYIRREACIHRKQGPDDGDAALFHCDKEKCLCTTSLDKPICGKRQFIFALYLLVVFLVLDECFQKSSVVPGSDCPLDEFSRLYQSVDNRQWELMGLHSEHAGQ